MRALLFPALVVVGVLALAGCTGENEVPAPSESAGTSAQQTKALSDDTVTFDEYRAGYDAFAACMDEAGYPLVERPMINDTIIDYAITEGGQESGSYDTCYDKYFAQLDMRWQSDHEDKSVMADYVRSCLVAKGVTPEEGADSQETMKLLWQQLADLGIDPGSMPGQCPMTR